MTKSTFFIFFYSIFLFLNAELSAEIQAEPVLNLMVQLQKKLLQGQNEDGAWLYKDQAIYTEGMTSLVVYALVQSGIPIEHSQIQKALQYLSSSKTEYTYNVSLKIVALVHIDATRYYDDIQQLTKILLKSQSSDGGFTYFNTGGTSDSSNTQFAALGLYSAARVGVKIPIQTWQKLLKFLKFVQSAESGGFGYKSAVPIPSMTAGCLAALHMAQTMTYKETRCGEWEGEALEKAGLRWLANYFQGNVKLPQNSKGQIEHYEIYFLYVLERMAHLMGVREFEGWDWFYQGIQILLKRAQEKKLEDPSDQAFALLFLSKGRTPILIGKIQLNGLSETDPHDIENLVFETSRLLKKSFAYQKVRLHGDLSDIPMLFFSGHEAFQLKKEELDCLKNYLEQGGLLVGEACCNRKEFARSFKEMTFTLLDGKSALEPLAPTHILYQLEETTLPPAYQTLFGAGFRCKTSILFSSRDLSCLWQNQETQSIEFQLGLNLLRFALAEGRLYDRISEQPHSPHQTANTYSNTGPLLIAKLAHESDWNNDAQDLEGLLQLFQKQTGQTGRYVVVKKGEPIPPIPILYLNGHQAPKLTPNQKIALQQFVQEGGILFGEACCDKIEFAEGFQRLLQELFPKVSLDLLPPEHFLYEGGFGTPPPLYSMRLGCREQVFFSPKDFSCHWDPKCPWKQNGLEKWAVSIGLNLLKSASQEKQNQASRATLPEVPDPEHRDAFRLAQIIHSGDYIPDTFMLETLLRQLHQKFGVSLYSKPIQVRLGKNNLFQYPFLYLTGHHLGDFNEQELSALRTYLERGGTLLADACCGSPRFREQFLQLVKQLFPHQTLSAMNSTHPMLQGISLKTREGVALDYPLILEEQNRVIVFFSPLDIGCGIQGHPCPKCKGYTPETAFRLIEAFFGYVMSH